MPGERAVSSRGRRAARVTARGDPAPDSMTDFIASFPDALPRAHCDELIARFEASPRRQPGRTGQGVDPSKKQSLDLDLSRAPELREDLSRIGDAVLRCLVAYVRRFPFLVVGAVATSIQGEDGALLELTHERIPVLDDQKLTRVVTHLYRLGDLNLQRYRAGKDGYHHWHSEIYPHPHDASQDSLHRVLFFLLYLNDVAEGGETAFYYQGAKIPPRAGTLLLAPAGFTHTHKGHVPRSNDKYVVTSWVLFRTAAQVYGRPPGA